MSKEMCKSVKPVGTRQQRLATKASYFICNGLLYKQIDGVAIEFPPGPSLAKVFLLYQEKIIACATIKTSFLPMVYR